MNGSVVRVALAERSYDISIGEGILATAGAMMLAVRRYSQAVVLTDQHVAPLAEQVADSLRAVGLTATIAVVPAGEATKCAAEADQLWRRLQALKADRKSVVVAVGGGVVGDLAGFVAATYARGIDFVQVPTSLLAQVDSSVGGKVGVNLPGAKNMVGAFWQPRLVIIDTRTLATLPEREFRSGLAEVIKYGVILDAEFFAFLEQNTQAVLSRETPALTHIIRRSCELKADVVRQDEREETGGRAVLNYGHTVAHAVEAVTAYGRYLHGEAVAIGMHCAARLAESLGRIDSAFVDRQQTLLRRCGLPTDLADLPPADLVEAMALDKKTEGGRLRFVLPTRLGRVELVEGISREAIQAVLDGVAAARR